MPILTLTLTSTLAEALTLLSVHTHLHPAHILVFRGGKDTKTLFLHAQTPALLNECCR